MTREWMRDFRGWRGKWMVREWMRDFRGREERKLDGEGVDEGEFRRREERGKWMPKEWMKE